MFTNICMGDMGKYNTNRFSKTFSYQDSDQSIPLYLALCIIKTSPPTLLPDIITMFNSVISTKTISVYL